MSQAVNIKRPMCPRCERPRRTCICQWVTPVACLPEVVILQHPLEVANAKGSGRLLHLSLPGSRLVTGEVFDERELNALLHAPFHDLQCSASGLKQPARHAILLYPDTPNDMARGISEPPLPDQAVLKEPGKLRMIILDGTWRKSRKMLHLNPLLQRLPRLPLRDTPASLYLIRKAHAPEQLSTLEATCYALMQLERDSGKYAPVLNGFNGFVAQQLAYTDHA